MLLLGLLAPRSGRSWNQDICPEQGNHYSQGTADGRNYELSLSTRADSTGNIEVMLE